MKRLIVLVFGMVLLVFGCGSKKEELYYPKTHFTKMTLDQADKKVVYLDWGTPLVYAGSMQTNLEESKGKTNEEIYVLVINNNTKDKGWVNLASVVKNPLAKATLLNTSQIYKTPSEISRDFFTMTAPMIGYVVEVQNDWARVQWYMSAYKVFTGKTEWTSYEWVKLNAISTNAKDADLLAILYTTYRKLPDWKTKWSTLTDEKQKQALSNEIDKEIIYLENVIKTFGGVGGPVLTTTYANDVVTSLNNLLYPAEESYEEDEYYEESDYEEDEYYEESDEEEY
ncbi:hypothetical protein [Thermospira aquatica]|uniref:DUF4843 domain-containing protein n=1 Tax=Thermospira aquatica TaxID=2828656 RepID=A0AAX3BE41_9SPIR|nr:hypothetical protein [Thermospira aquatica]URA10511.1 hypothetical protein KDW03_01535 [Thermospira aquatica]